MTTNIFQYLFHKPGIFFQTSIFLILFSILLPGCKEDDNVMSGDVPWPEWIFYHWVWEDEGTQESATQLVDDYLAHDIPVGVIIVDSPWETGYNDFVFDSGLYSDPQAMVDYFHSKDVRFILWITSMINVDVPELYQYAAERDYFLKKCAGCPPAVLSWWKGDGSLIDFFNPEAVEWYKSLVEPILDLGIDGWKCDGADYSALLSPYSPGAGGMVPRLDYSHAYYRFFHDFTREVLGDDRVNLCRPVDNYGLGLGGELAEFAPKDINFAGWVGDQDATFDGLKKALDNMYFSAEQGYLTAGSDIGGYREESEFPGGRSKKLFIRWAQLGAMSPIMENGGGGEHRPWMFDTETTDIYRLFTKLHYAMVPYLMQEAEKAYREKRSMQHFFNRTGYRYMIGDDLYVQPILSESDDITVKLPDGGRWVYIFDHSMVYDGGSSLEVNIPLDEYPVFVREGSPLVRDMDPSAL